VLQELRANKCDVSREFWKQNDAQWRGRNPLPELTKSRSAFS
jgi:hypothetical protein